MIYGFVIIVLFLGFRRGVVPTVTGWFRRRARRSPSTTSEEGDVSGGIGQRARLRVSADTRVTDEN